MKPTYSIQEPCTEDWNKMNPAQQGRHCQLCCKTVVDFSKKNDAEIVDFLKTNSNKKICGRFRATQLVAPAGTRAEKKKSRYRVFFAALFVVFGGMLFTSCSTARIGDNPPVMGTVAFVPDSTQAFTPDTIPHADSTKKTGQVNVIAPEEIEHYKMGDVAFDPADTLK